MYRPNNGFTRLTQGLGQRLTNSRQQFQQTFRNFGNNKYVSGTSEFLNSNSIIAKFAFLIMIVVLFVILLRLGTHLLTWIMSTSSNPKIINGMKEAHLAKVVPQDPKASGSKTIKRSVNQQDGIEFTYSVWLFIEDFKQDGKYKHIFHKGNDGFSTSGSETGLNQPNNAPGMYLDKDTNNLVILMNTYENINEKVTVQDIPLNKWINVIMRVENRKLDVYINGTIVLRHTLSGVPKQNYGDVYINMNGGFQGMISDLWYHDYALTTYDILKIIQKGPNMKMDQTSLDVFPPYLSLRWYFNQ